jgi:hypothetical protein
MESILMGLGLISAVSNPTKKQGGISMSKLSPKSIALLILTLCPLVLFAEADREKLVIADFEEGEAIGLFSVSSRNPMDEDQWIKMNWEHDDALGKPNGKSLRLDYDVDSSESAKATFWFRLENQDLSPYDTLHLYLKGSEGSRGNVTLQFVDGNYRTSPYVIGRIEERWKEFRVPFKRFTRITDWSTMREFDIVIDDINTIPKEGSLWVDEISVSSSSLK